jgi:hypothetical protein
MKQRCTPYRGRYRACEYRRRRHAGCNDSTVSVEHNCSFAVVLSGAGCDRLTHRFDRERCWNSICVDKVSAHELDELINDPAAISNIL